MVGAGPQGEGPRDGSPPMAEAMGAGLQFAVAIVGSLFIGRWLDDRLGTEPWLLLLGVMIGASAGFYSMYRRLVVGPRERRKMERDE